MRRFGLSTLLLGAGLLVVGSAPSFAQSETFTTNIPAQAVNFTTSFTLPQFNTTLGTLTGVTLRLDSNIVATLSVRNVSATTTESYTQGFAAISMNITGPNSTNIVSNASTPNNLAGSVAPNTTDSSHSSIPVSGTSGDVTVSSGSWSFYEGPGNASLNFSAAGGPASASGSGGSDLFYNASGTAGGTAKVVYTYVAPAGPATPEPGTWAMLMAIGSTGLVAVRRRRVTK